LSGVPGNQTPKPDAVVTPAGRGVAELRVQRSRFLAWVDHAPDEDAARAVIAEATRLHHDARHVCWGWRLGFADPPREHRSDAGEPAGSAGEPILAALRAAGITSCVAVVVRWFGGVKLGTGGLGRAYGEAARRAAAAAPLRTVLLGRRLWLALEYPQVGTARHLLSRHGGRVLAEDYAAVVTWTVWLPRAHWREFAAALSEATAGAVRPRPADSE
jgi:uncharacterized YigZ family protein